MNITVALCDDDKSILTAEEKLLHTILSNKTTNHIIDSFDTPQKLLASDKLYDMVFLDVEMNGISGIETAHRMLDINKDCFVFFVTHYPFYLDDAFDAKAFRYLTKPLDAKRISDGIDVALELIRDKMRTISVTNFDNKLTTEIEISSIIYIETSRRHTHIVTTDYDFIAEESFTRLKELIEAEVDYFVQPHQSFFVNMRYVAGYDKTDIKLSHCDKEYHADVSRRGYKVFSKKFFFMVGRSK